MNYLIRDFKEKNSILIILILIISIIFDILWIKIYDLVPAWDQGFHLSNLYKYHYLIKDCNILDINWWKMFWSVTDNYRGPLTYILSGIFTQISQLTLNNAILSNTIFNILNVITIYKISNKFFSREIGLWASFFYSFNSYIFNLRNDYLIDISQLSFLYLNYLLLSYWYLSKSNNYLLKIFSGISLGLLFLVKPTGIFYLFLPILLILINNFNFRLDTIKKSIKGIFLYIVSFFLIIFPWVSINWLTIISSTINAWNWGIKYQDGLEANSLEAWTYYPVQLIRISNPYLFIICILFFLIYFIKYKDINLKININNLNNVYKIKSYLWLISFPINILLLNIIMSTKDTRFIIPLIPYINIITGILISSLRGKYTFSRITKLLTLTITISSLLINQIEVYKDKYNLITANKKSPNLIHEEIINEVNKITPNLESTIGFLPDTKYFNAFNLDAEAVRQNNGIRVRQIVSNKDSYKEDLKNFDWFILKTGSQGVMSSIAKDKLGKMIIDSKDFSIYKKWKTYDNSDILLVKKNIFNQNVSFKKCQNEDIFFSVNKITGGLNINLDGKLSNLNESQLIIDMSNKDNIKKLNFSIPKIINSNYLDSCINYNFLYSTDILFNDKISEFKINGYLINDIESIPRKIKYSDQASQKEIINSSTLSNNKIEKVTLMGKYLQEGEFDKLFKMAGLINQSDPDQKYLENAEIIFKNRLDLKSTNIDDLYALAISQILQKKAYDAKITLERILLKDASNANTYFAKSIVEIYRFDFKNALESLNRSINFNKNKELDKTLEEINRIVKLLNLKFH